MSPIDFPGFVWLWVSRQGQTMPQVHDRIARWLERRWQNGDRRMLLMAFRGCGKSTLVGLFAVWLLVRDPNVRILVLAADLALARKMVRNVKRLIERHPLARHLRPKRVDQWAAEQFTVERPGELRDPSMLARGIGANITGSRADVIICDDVEVPNTSDSASKRADLRDRLGEIDYVLVPGGLQLYVGTPHTYYTIYADCSRREVGESAPFLDGFKRLEVPIVDEEGQSLWPERFSLEAIARIRRHTGPNKFHSQMMLKPVSIAEGRLDPDRLRSYDHELDWREAQGRAVLSLAGTRLVSAACWWDPAYGARAATGTGTLETGASRGDASVVAAVFSDGQGRWYLHRVRYLNTAPVRNAPDADADPATRQCREVAGFVRDLHLPAVSLEINGLGRFLPGLLRKELARCGVSCSVVEVFSRQPKHLRIVEAFDAVLAAGALHAHRSVWDTPFIGEMRDWRPDARDKGHDDGLDAVAGCLKSDPVRLGAMLPRPVREAEWRGDNAPPFENAGWSV
ncbi:Terminase large subunit gp17-like C-terminal domain-containing protein [uncultured Gammaproteobacteria bacterium]